MPPALTSEEVRSIQEWERTHRSPEVRRLLGEIFRLRIVARSAAQVAEHSGHNHLAPLDILLNRLRRELAELPFLNEERAAITALFPGDSDKRKK